MKIGVVGGGAIGLLCSAYLSEKHEVTLYTRGKEQADIIQKNGVKVFGSRNWTAKITAEWTPSYKEEIILIAVKQHHLPTVFEKLKELPPKRIVFLQNGLGHIDRLKEIPHHEAYIGIVEHGALKLSFNTVRHTGIGKISISPFREGKRQIVEDLDINDPLFPISFTEDWKPIVMKKLVANAVINPLTALFGVRNGQLVENSELLFIAQKLFLEICAVLDLKKKEELWEYVAEIAKKTRHNRSSMLIDRDNKKKTEIDAILGVLLQKGQQKGIPIHLIEFLYKAIKGLENLEE